MNLEVLKSQYKSIKETALFGRYITNLDIEKCFGKFPETSKSVIGYSVENRPIYKFEFGTGSKKILLWSQMHGNESTTTKALFDCFNGFMSNSEVFKTIFESCTLCVIPILNPDGAHYYTRVNANEVDLNRDAQDLSQPESKVLRQVFNDFKPDFCFNLHGQRTIFSVGDTNVSATLSFLSPSQDVERSLTSNRKTAMALISDINHFLQPEIPNGIARYDDGFNLNCVGDTFQNFGVPTILFEAGHYQPDYDREDVRQFIFLALIKSLYAIATNAELDYKNYFKIPENQKNFYDIIIRNASVNDVIRDVAIQFKEELQNEKVVFKSVIEEIGNLLDKYGHREINADRKRLTNENNEELELQNQINFVYIGKEKVILNIH